MQLLDFQQYKIDFQKDGKDFYLATPVLKTMDCRNPWEYIKKYCNDVERVPIEKIDQNGVKKMQYVNVISGLDIKLLLEKYYNRFTASDNFDIRKASQQVDQIDEKIKALENLKQKNIIEFSGEIEMQQQNELQNFFVEQEYLKKEWDTENQHQIELIKENHFNACKLAEQVMKEAQIKVDAILKKAKIRSNILTIQADLKFNTQNQYWQKKYKELLDKQTENLKALKTRHAVELHKVQNQTEIQNKIDILRSQKKRLLLKSGFTPIVPTT